MTEQPPLSYIQGLIKLMVDNKLDGLSVGEIKLSKVKYDPPVVNKVPQQKMPELDPSEDQIMSWSLSEPMPNADAIAEILSSEPKKKRSFSKKIV